MEWNTWMSICLHSPVNFTLISNLCKLIYRLTWGLHCTFTYNLLTTDRMLGYQSIYTRPDSVHSDFGALQIIYLLTYCCLR